QVGTAGEQLGRPPRLAQQPDRLFDRRRLVVGEVLHAFPPFGASASRTFLGVSGRCGTRTPMALNTAVLRAAAVETIGGSPTPITPRSGMSIRWTVIFGMSRMPASL